MPRKSKPKPPVTEKVALFSIEKGDVLFDPATGDVADVVWVGWHGGGNRFPKRTKSVDVRVRNRTGVARVTGGQAFTIDKVVDDA